MHTHDFLALLFVLLSQQSTELVLLISWVRILTPKLLTKKEGEKMQGKTGDSFCISVNTILPTSQKHPSVKGIQAFQQIFANNFKTIKNAFSLNPLFLSYLFNST